MKTRNIILYAAAILLFILCHDVNAQYVGEATPAEIKKAATSQPLFDNSFNLKCGLFQPSGFNKLSPDTFNDIADGNVSMEKGLFIELGYSMYIGKGKVGAYFCPVLIGAYMSGTDFKSATEADTRQFTATEIAERYGVFYRPVKKLFIAGYYRPAITVPLGFNANQFTSKAKFDGVTTKMFTHTAGISVRYRFISIYYEYYMGKPTLEVYDNNTDTTVTGKIPVRLSILSVAFAL